MTIRTCTLLGAFLILVSLAAGCGVKKNPDAVLATIGGEVVKLSDFDERISNLPVRYQEIVKKKKKEYLDELVNDTLLYQEALRKKINTMDDVKKVVEEARKKILIARLLQDEVDSAIKITDADIEAFYDSHKSEYVTPEVMRVSHILVPTKEEAEVLVGELASGADFAALARAKSVDPTAQGGGDIGYFPKGQLMPEFENACASLGINQISGAVKTKLGYHIIKLADRRQPEQKPISEVQGDIMAKLRSEKRQKLFNELLTKLHSETEIKINESIL